MDLGGADHHPGRRADDHSAEVGGRGLRGVSPKQRPAEPRFPAEVRHQGPRRGRRRGPAQTARAVPQSNESPPGRLGLFRPRAHRAALRAAEPLVESEEESSEQPSSSNVSVKSDDPSYVNSEAGSQLPSDGGNEFGEFGDQGIKRVKEQ